jgi:uncharacterized secreted protein with C-terminal beta-propeller domain
MQSEIKKRARLYAIAAILLAVVLVSLCYKLGYIPEVQLPQSSSIFRTFSSYTELRTFLTTNSKTQGPYYVWGPLDTNIVRLFAIEGFTSAVTAAPKAPSVDFEYSATNIQVAGVDEADIVKTDGEYIYLVAGNNVSILRAYPQEEARMISKITFNDTYPVGIFVSGDRLVVLGSKYNTPLGGYYNNYFVDIKTFANVYDISDKTNPQLLRNFTMSGSYFNSRMIGKYVYFVISQPAYVIYDTVVLPKIYSTSGFKEISPSEIHHSNASDDYYLFTTFVALNMQNTSEEPTYIPLMLGGTSNMYVSLSNIYVTFPEPDQETSIYRIHMENSNLTCEAQGKVLGRELNQFSMDEFNNHFRIATTTRTDGTTQNNLYVLDMNLSTVGRLENIAPNETIDSARFIGNRCYLATSVVRRDPFFVVDVENASDPKILGYLKISGFTRYLHPYDENHVIGVGRDENNRVEISLFDVSNVTNPTKMGNYIAEGDWSDSSALTEHKAFLFDRSKDLLVIPVSVYDADVQNQQMYTWQGAFVFNVTLSDGLILRGKITHQEVDRSIDLGVNDWDMGYWVQRSLYIQNVLYTTSDMKVKLNNFEDLAFIKEIRVN